jgi:hypothetical protein
MELPEPIIPGRYSAKQIQEILGLKSRQAVWFIAQREGWRAIKLGPTKLYDVGDIVNYLNKTGKGKSATATGPDSK